MWLPHRGRLPSIQPATHWKVGIEKLRDRQEKLGTLIGELEGRAIEHRGTDSGSAKVDADLQVFAHELLEIDRSLKQLKGEAHALSLTIAKAESLLRKTDRQKRMRDAGIDSEDVEQVVLSSVSKSKRG